MHTYDHGRCRPPPRLECGKRQPCELSEWASETQWALGGDASYAAAARAIATSCEHQSATIFHCFYVFNWSGLYWLIMDKFLKRQTESSTSSGSDETKIKKKCLYDDSYLKFGFTLINHSVLFALKLYQEKAWSHRSYYGTSIQSIQMKKINPWIFLKLN